MIPKRIRRRRYQRLLGLVVFLVFLLLFRLSKQHYKQVPILNLKPGTYKVERVIDGDTLLLTNGVRVRLIGVDCPEIRSNDQVERIFAQFATLTVETWLRACGGQVRLEFDREKTDKYGRVLAYVWFFDNSANTEVMLNEKLIREGIGRAQLQYNYSAEMKERFRRAEEQARGANAGIWSRDWQESEQDLREALKSFR